MRVIEGTERRQILQRLLPAMPEPGVQAGFHLAASDVGVAYGTPRGACAVVACGPAAYVFGKPRADLLGKLAKAGCRPAALVGAVSSIDVRPAAPRDGSATPMLRHVLVAGPVDQLVDVPAGFVWRRLEADDVPELYPAGMTWLFNLYESPTDAEFAWVAVRPGKSHVQMCVAGISTSSDYVEIGVASDQSARSPGDLALSVRATMRTAVLGAGKLPTAVIGAENARALAANRRWDWEIVGEDWMLSLA